MVQCACEAAPYTRVRIANTGTLSNKNRNRHSDFET